MLSSQQKTALTIALATGGILGLLYLAGRAAAAQTPSPGGNPPLPPAGGGTSPAGGGTSPADATAAAIAAAVAAAQAGGGASPPSPGAASSPLSGTPLPNPAPLVQGTRYLARLELTGLDKLGTRDQIKGSLESLGFTNVQVYMTEAELPPGILQAARQNITNGSRWVLGTWGQASQLVPKPDPIQQAWVA